MFNYQERKNLLNQFTKLINLLSTTLENQQPKKNDEEQGYSMHGDCNNNSQNFNNLGYTIDIISQYIQQLKDLKKVLDISEKILLTVPLEVGQLQQHLQETLEYQRSKIGSSILISNYIIQNSDIDKAKLDGLQQKLSDFIKNYPSYNEMICLEHNQKTEFVDISNDQNIIDRRVCINCDKIKIRLRDLLEQYLMQFFNFKIYSEKKRFDIKKDIQTLMNQVESQKNIENFYIDMGILFKKRIDIIDNIQNNKNNKNLDSQQLSNIVIDYSQTQADFINYQTQFITKLKYNMKLDLINAQTHLNTFIKNLSMEKKQDETPKQLNIDQQLIYTKLSEIQQSQLCQALCFNKDDNLISTAQHNVIVIWNFQGGKMNQITELKRHKEEISCLLFDKDSDSLISAGGDFDCSINLWKKTEQDWKLSNSYQNNKNKGGIKVMLQNKQGDQLIIGTQKGQILIFNIHFQMSILELIKEYQVDQNKKPILGLSLNDESNYLVQCGWDKNLRLFSFGENIQCKQTQICSDYGMRIKFIDNSSFVLIQRDGILLYFKIEWNQFIAIQKLKLSSEIHDYIYTPIYYNEDSKLLIVKHYRTIYFLKLVNGKFEKIHQLEYQYDQIFATISNNGQFLVPWVGLNNNGNCKGDLHNLYQIYELQY